MDEITDQVDAAIKEEINNHDDTNEIMFDECSVILKDKQRLIKHKRNQHEQHICNDCGNTFSGRRKLSEHLRIYRKSLSWLQHCILQKIFVPSHSQRLVFP